MLYLTWYMVYMYVILATIGQRDELLTQCQHRCLISFCIKNDLFLNLISSSDDIIWLIQFYAHFASLIFMKYFPKWNFFAGLEEKRRLSPTSHIVLQFKVSLKIRVELTRTLLLAARRLLNLSLSLKRGEREVCEANIGKHCCPRGKEGRGKA